MDSDESEKIQGAFERIRLIEDELTSHEESKDETDSDRYLELIDDLLTLQMGIGPSRRKLATGRSGEEEQTGKNM